MSLLKKMSSKKKIKKKKVERGSDPIVIDKDLVFKNEKQLYAHFKPQIEVMESEFLSLRSENDFSEDEMKTLENELEQTLEEPDEIWKDVQTFARFTLHHFIRAFEYQDQTCFYVAVVHIYNEVPTFIFLHFVTKDQGLIENYRRGEQIYNRGLAEMASFGIEGDALTESDPLSLGLFESMLKLRSDKDIPVKEFGGFSKHREETIESADEIWRNTDLNGNVLVSFIKEYPEIEPDLTYIVVTQEEQGANVHALLFSFPTRDPSLVERYRHGENLQADEIVQESSH